MELLPLISQQYRGDRQNVYIQTTVYQPFKQHQPAKGILELMNFTLPPSTQQPGRATLIAPMEKGVSVREGFKDIIRSPWNTSAAFKIDPL